MKLSSSLMVVMALPLASCDVSHRRRGFRVHVNRFESKDCHEAQSLEGGNMADGFGPILHQEGCHDWTDGKTFNSFRFDQYTLVQELELPTDKDCALLIYEEGHCGGRLLWAQDRMNTREKLGQCWSLNYGIKGMSAKLTCRKKDTQADWERELVWKEPLVVTFLTTEVVQVSTATN
ncbi:uncharacterized protein MYCGRDRAFT_96846 [Zymoseptoria tritici IPO323]|uniref:Uncharacterized protein n=3 Tax=Zymoseptoria tritici TaxID=1047171 RepID=F9XMA8_ZYMTI|nr:uncharacterized protein MYCGRDRAFT_96846 [Zymoseptoria tritici IPO323]EGP83478.1 hypothetical protein MYCGRDRAFT_96846 [Zymoseptoria tritici IPO323]